MKTYLIVKWINWRRINKFFAYFLLLGFIVTKQNTYAQQSEVFVNNVVGSAFLSDEVTRNQAKAQALNDAKLNALKTAHVVENINSFQVLFTSQYKNDFSQFFSSDIQSEMKGAVKSYRINADTIFFNSEVKQWVSKVTIDATVIKYESEPDVTFDVNIEGIKAVYNNDADLTFEVKTTKNAYLTIFNITDKEASLFYPNSYEKQERLDPSIVYQFPPPKATYTYSLNTDLKNQETNRLIFVFTKNPMPYIKMDKNQITSTEDIFTWIYSITPDQRKIEYKTLVIQK